MRGPRILIREPQPVRCARGVRGPRRRTRRGSSHCDPQIECSTGQQPPLTRRNTNAVVSLCRHSEICKARLRSEKLMCVCTRSPFIPAPRGGVRVAKHARQLSLLVLLTLEDDWALRRDPISQSLWRYVERDWLIGNVNYFTYVVLTSNIETISWKMSWMTSSHINLNIILHT